MDSPHCSTYIWRSSDGMTPLTETEWNALAQEAQIPEATIQRSRERDQRARLVICETALLVTLRIWSGHTGKVADDLEDVTREWDMFLGNDFVLIRSDTQLPISIKTPSQVLYALLDESIDGCYPAMDAMDAQIDALEIAVYSPEGMLEIGPALQLKKQLLLLQNTALDSSVTPYLQDIFDRSLRLTEQIDLHRDILSGVLEAIMAQTSNRLNQQMKRLTAIAAVALPITAITGFFGMNIGHLERAPSWSLWVAVGVMAVGSTTAFAYFRRRGHAQYVLVATLNKGVDAAVDGIEQVCDCRLSITAPVHTDVVTEGMLRLAHTVGSQLFWEGEGLA